MEKQTFPAEDERLLRMSQIARWLNVSEAAIYKWLQDDMFPKPIALGNPESTSSAKRWPRQDIIDWLEARPRVVGGVK